MRRIVQPVAFFVVLLFGALPAAPLACALTCLSARTHAADHHHHHAADDSTALKHSATGSSILASATPSCDNTGLINVTLTPVSAKNDGTLIDFALFGPGTPQLQPHASPRIAWSTHSSPGLRTGLISLRI